MEKLFMNYCKPVIRRKKKGAGKGDKLYFDSLGWDENKTRRQYLRELAEADKNACGLFLCKVELNDLIADQWWNVPTYREKHLTKYRGRITAIRKEYGLSSKDVKAFMRGI